MTEIVDFEREIAEKYGEILIIVDRVKIYLQKFLALNHTFLVWQFLNQRNKITIIVCIISQYHRGNCASTVNCTQSRGYSAVISHRFTCVKLHE